MMWETVYLPDYPGGRSPLLSRALLNPMLKAFLAMLV